MVSGAMLKQGIDPRGSDFYYMQKYHVKNLDEVSHYDSMLSKQMSKSSQSAIDERKRELQKGCIRKIKMFYTTYDDDKVY